MNARSETNRLSNLCWMSPRVSCALVHASQLFSKKENEKLPGSHLCPTSWPQTLRREQMPHLAHLSDPTHVGTWLFVNLSPTLWRGGSTWQLQITTDQQYVRNQHLWQSLAGDDALLSPFCCMVLSHSWKQAKMKMSPSESVAGIASDPLEINVLTIKQPPILKLPRFSFCN